MSRLQDVGEEAAGGLLERRRRVPVLSRRQGLPGQPPAQLGVGVELLRAQHLLHPLELAGPQLLPEADGVLEVERHPAVEHQLDLVPDQLAAAGHQLDVFPQPLEAVGRAVRTGQLGRPEAELQVPVGVAAGRVAEQLVAGRTAEQLVHRTLQQLSLEVPQGEVDGADRVGVQAGGAVGRSHAHHHVVALLRGQAGFPLEPGPEVVVDDRRHRAPVAGRPRTPSCRPLLRLGSRSRPQAGVQEGR